MSIRRTALTLSLLAGFAPPALGADVQAAISSLVVQGRYWQGRSRGDLAADAWQKLLRLDPAQPDALYGMGLGEIEKNNDEAAYAFLARLRNAQPKHALVARLEAALAGNSAVAAELATTRELALAGRNEEAVQRYRELFGKRAPEAEIGLAYYQTLGGMPRGWDEARLGLQRLERENPNQARYALALAQHLSLRELTRADAIARLARLSRSAEVGRPASAAWRQALLWLNVNGSGRAPYLAYLEQHEDDAEIRARLELAVTRDAVPGMPERGPERGAPAPRGGVLQQGFDALSDGALELAAQQLDAVLKDKPNQADALGGLGLIRLRQERFGEARQLLERASRQGKAAQWRTAHRKASYWEQLQKADVARKAGDLPLAQKWILQAVRIKPHEATAQIALAEVRAALKQYQPAEMLLLAVLAREPKQAAAIAAYADLLVKQEKFDAALRMLERLTPQQREQFGTLARIRSEAWRSQAVNLQARGDLAGARTVLEDALVQDPASSWVRFDLGRVYLQAAQDGQARSMISALLLEGAGQPDALHAAALLCAENQDWNDAMQALEQVPPSARTADMASLQKRIALHLQVERALALARQGQLASASALLRQAEQAGERGDEQIAAMAAAYAEAGDAARALMMMRQLLSKAGKNNAALMLQYAGVLLNTRQDGEFATLMRQLQGKTLTAREGQGYARLRTVYLLRQADLVRESGDLAGAYDVLAPLLAELPDDPGVLAGLARMYGAGGEPAQALALYGRALAARPNDLALLLGGLGAAIDAKAFDQAQALAARATGQDADNPRVLTGWARLYRAQGRNRKADEYYRAALAAENRGRQVQVLAAEGAEDNPFRRRDSAAAPLRPERRPGLPDASRATLAAYTQPAAGRAAAGHAGTGHGHGDTGHAVAGHANTGRADTGHADTAAAPAYLLVAAAPVNPAWRVFSSIMGAGQKNARVPCGAG